MGNFFLGVKRVRLLYNERPKSRAEPAFLDTVVSVSSKGSWKTGETLRLAHFSPNEVNW